MTNINYVQAAAELMSEELMWHVLWRFLNGIHIEYSMFRITNVK